MKVANETPPHNRAQRWRLALFAVSLAALFFAAEHYHLGDRVKELRVWIESFGAWGPVVFVLLYISATICMAPGIVLTLMAGALFGSFVGVIVVSLGSTLGASAAFLIARYAARESMTAWLSGTSRLRRIDELTRKNGPAIVAFCRLIPLFPFNLLNYAFGLTGITFRAYFFWSWLCMLPATIVYVAGADAFTRGLSEGRAPVALIVLILVGMAVLIGAIRYARSSLKE